MTANAGTPKRILVDFDRVVHRYSQGWKDGSIYDFPVCNAIESLRALMNAGYEVVIFTTKSNRPQRNQEIKEWLEARGIKDIEITNTKLPAMAIIDDRAIRFTNWNDILRYFI